MSPVACRQAWWTNSIYALSLAAATYKSRRRVSRQLATASHQHYKRANWFSKKHSHSFDLPSVVQIPSSLQPTIIT